MTTTTNNTTIQSDLRFEIKSLEGRAANRRERIATLGDYLSIDAATHVKNAKHGFKVFETCFTQRATEIDVLTRELITIEHTLKELNTILERCKTV